MSQKYFIQIIGGNATGKSTLAYKLTQQYKGDIKTVGKQYYISEKDNCVKGGADPMKVTNEQRRELLKDLWLQDTKIVLMQGMIVISKINMDYFKQLANQYQRNIIIVHLYGDNQKVIYPRLFKRSGGKQMTKKREKGIMDIQRKSIASSKYAKSIGLNVIQFEIKDDNSSDQILNILIRGLN